MIYIGVKNAKAFMGMLFGSNIFDDMFVTSCEINTITQISISGVKSKKWSGQSEIDENELISNVLYCHWSEIRTVVYELIKGKKTPSLMKMIFAKKVETQAGTDDGIITVKYENDEVTIITGYQQNTFSLDKSGEKEWDKFIINMLTESGIEYRDIA